MALERLKINLQEKYSNGRIKKLLIDDITLDTFSDKGVISMFDDFLKFIPVEELLQATAGAISYQEKEEIVKALWKSTKKNMTREEKNDEQSEIEKNLDNLTLLYISLGGRNFVKEKEIIGKIDKLIEEYKAGDKEEKTLFDRNVRN